MNDAEKKEMEALGRVKCECFRPTLTLQEYLDPGKVPKSGQPPQTWVQTQKVQEFLKKFHPEFRAKLNRYIELLDTKSKSERRPTLF